MDKQILEILVKHSITPTVALLDAMKDVYAAGAASVQAAQGGNEGDEEEERDTPLTYADIAALKAAGIDPALKFRVKNSTFTVTGWKPSRYKYPVSCVNQNGRRFKFPIISVVAHQRAAKR